MDEFSRALLKAEERGYERGFRAGETAGYNRGWREGMSAARQQLDRLTGEVQRLLTLLGMTKPLPSQDPPTSSTDSH